MASTSHQKTATAFAEAGDATGIAPRWLVLNDPSTIRRGRTGYKASCARGSGFPNTVEKTTESEKPSDSSVSYSDPLITGTWTTVTEQMALMTVSSRTREAWWKEPELTVHARPAFGPHCNIIVDPWWPSHFLSAEMTVDPDEVFPMLGWRDRIATGGIMVYSPAFWGELNDESHLL